MRILTLTEADLIDVDEPMTNTFPQCWYVDEPGALPDFDLHRWMTHHETALKYYEKYGAKTEVDKKDRERSKSFMRLFATIMRDRARIADLEVEASFRTLVIPSDPDDTLQDYLAGR